MITGMIDQEVTVTNAGNVGETNYMITLNLVISVMPTRQLA